MNIIIKSSASAAAKLVAGQLIDFVVNYDSPVIGFATGRTQLPVYDELADACSQAKCSLKNLRSFNLDEYVGLIQSSPYSFAFYMHRNLVRRTDVRVENVNLMDGSSDPHLEAARYEALIKASGGIDFQLLSLGANGHIGFNEPGTSFFTRTHVASLTSETLSANKDDLPTPPPSLAITQGLNTIFEAKHVVMLVTGRAKAKAARDFIEGPVDPCCPASILQGHPETCVVLDEEAASELQQTETYSR